MTNPKPPAPIKPKKSGKTMPVVLITLAALTVTGAAWFFLRPALLKGGSPKSEPRIKGVLHLESFVVNLADPEGNHFLRAGIDLGLVHPIEEAKGKNPVPTGAIRDVIVEVLSGGRSDALLSPDGKIKLKEELIQKLQARIPELGVSEIYLTDFLVQR